MGVGSDLQRKNTHRRERARSLSPEATRRGRRMQAPVCGQGNHHRPRRCSALLSLRFPHRVGRIIFVHAFWTLAHLLRPRVERAPQMTTRSAMEAAETTILGECCGADPLAASGSVYTVRGSKRGEHGRLDAADWTSASRRSRRRFSRGLIALRSRLDRSERAISVLRFAVMAARRR